MSQKKKHRSASLTAKNHPPQGIRQFVKPFLAVILVLIFACGLIYIFTPSGKLEPYDKFKQKPPSDKKAESNGPAANPNGTVKKISDTLEQDPGALAKKVADTAPSAPPPRLPRETMESIAKGMRLAEKGQFGQAETEFQKAAQLSPNSPEVFSIWGAALRMEKKFEGANKRFQRALELAPNDEEILFNWGMSKLEENDSDGAVRLFQKTVEVNPRHYLAYNYMGKALGQKKDYVKETEMYRKTLEIDPNFAQAHFNLAVVLSIRNKVDEAAPHFERAIELDKQFEQPFVVQMLKALGRYKPKDQPENKPKPESESTAKLDSGPKTAGEPEKSEGSGHKMEGSSAKEEKDSTNVKGRVLFNGQPADPGTVVIMEAKNKLRTPGQKTQNVSIRQKNLQFEPDRSVVQVGANIAFVNGDLEVHNIYSKSLNNQFNLGAMAAGSSKSVKLTEPGPVVLRCNMHKDMIGVIFVVPNGYYTIADKNGNYHFEKLPNIEYLLQVWNPRLGPSEVESHMKGLKLNGADQTLDFDIATASQPGEIHDMVDEKDYKAIADLIESEVLQAIDDWQAGKDYISRKRMLNAITRYYEGEGLKGAITKSFSEKRGQALEEKLDVIRKKISGLGPYKDQKFTRESLQDETRLAVNQLRENIRELEHRLNPSAGGVKPEAKH
ncbi:MAG: tetratricopeptide repeat protein [Nitrospinae bacterium]|nr:tetratricopeptide repeat protein [Nitrospinota bacterium]